VKAALNGLNIVLSSG